MKKSSYILLAVLITLALLSLYLYKKRGSSHSYDKESRNFAFKDTAGITRIFIADKDGASSTLERTKKGWVVNGKFNCRSDAILNLMEAIKNVEVKMPVNKGARDNVIRTMAAQAMKVEIYKGEDLVKEYYVGHETPDSEGSYMLLTDPESGANYDEPFVCFIPGFQGYLMPRFIAREDEWRDRLCLNFTPPQIRQIKVDNKETQDSSFTIGIINTKTFSLTDKKGRSIAFDEFKMKQYIAYFQNISYESLLTYRQKRLIDSLEKERPFFVITVSENNFKKNTYEFFHKHPSVFKPSQGVMFKYDPERFYMRFNDEKEWALVQAFVFGKLLIKYDYFFPPSVKK